MENKFKGIVVFAKDHNEKDKLITLLCVEKGLLNILVKGVKNANAKLKYAKELFTFGDFITTAKGNFYILTACDLIDDFPEIKNNPEKFMEASNITNIARNISQYGEEDVKLFLDYISAIKTLCYEATQNNIVLAKFLINLFQNAGYKLSLSKCASCGQEFFGKKYFNADTGEIVCSACKNESSVELDNSVYSNLRLLSNSIMDKLSTIKLNNFEQTIQFLINNYKLRFNKNITLY